MKRLPMIKSIQLLGRIARKGMIFTAVSTIVLSIQPTVLTMITVSMIERVQSEQKLSSLLFPIIGFLFYLAAQTFFSSLNQISLNAWLFESTNANLKKMFYKHVGKMELEKFENSVFLDEVKQCEEVLESESIPLSYYKFLQLAKNFISASSLAILLFSYHYNLLICLLFVSLPILVTRWIRGKSMFHKKMSQVRENRKLSEYRMWFGEPRFHKELRVSDAFDYMLKKWHSLDEKHRKEIYEEKQKENREIFLCNFLRMSALVTVNVYTVNLGIKGALSAALVSGALMAYYSAQNEVTFLFEKLGNLSEWHRRNEKFFSFMERKSFPESGATLTAIDDISLKNVSFTYPNGERTAIDRMTLHIQKGEKIAVVGINGSGKTTLGKILTGAFLPTDGSILWNDVDHLHIDRRSLFQRIAVVPQNIPKFKTTVREFLFLEENDSRSEQAMSFLKKLQLDTVLKKRTEEQLGVDFGGVELSGGQWQSLQIITAWMKNADFYVLDEATSAIDPIKESEILQYFLEMIQEKTAIIITHRLSICRKVDRILLLENGRIVEDGSHKTLMKQKEHYYKMYLSQMRHYIDENA